MVETTVETKKELFTIKPWDEHNQKTVANAHPNDWVNPEPAANLHYLHYELEDQNQNPHASKHDAQAFLHDLGGKVFPDAASDGAADQDTRDTPAHNLPHRLRRERMNPSAHGCNDR